MGKRVGIVGFGFLGSYLAHKLNGEKEIDLAFVYDLEQKKLKDLDPSLVINSLAEAPSRQPDLVVEMVDAEWVSQNAAFVLEFSDLLIASVSAFADERLHRNLDILAALNKRRYFISHGAIAGLDGIRDGKEIIQKVKITTIRPAHGYFDLKNLIKKNIKARTVIYEGPVRKACRLFPKNVNLFATVAIHGVGFDQTQCAIVVDPEIDIIRHIIEVKGQGLRWKIEVQAIPVGDSKKVYVPESFFQTVRRICSEKYGGVLI
jgi:aspartate dehydrogenase